MTAEEQGSFWVCLFYYEEGSPFILPPSELSFQLSSLGQDYFYDNILLWVKWRKWLDENSRINITFQAQRRSKGIDFKKKRIKTGWA